MDYINNMKVEKLNAYSVSSLEALFTLYDLSEDIVTRHIPGDIVECGVRDGGSAAVLSLPVAKSDRQLWLYDSFQGLPMPTFQDTPEAYAYAGKAIGSKKRVMEALAIAEFPVERVVIREGWFKDSFEDVLPKRVALLHVDCDWYESVLNTLFTFYPLVHQGGIIVIDDFGHWEGARRAFYDFVHQIAERPLVERFGHSRLYWVKGKQHNREQLGGPPLCKPA